MISFQLTQPAQQIVFKPGAINELAKLIEQNGWQRLLLCTIPHLIKNRVAEKVIAQLGEKLVANYHDVEPHVQEVQLAEAVGLAESRKIDAIVGLGGGSPIGMAKAISMAVEENRLGKPIVVTSTLGAHPLLPVIAIPTTYAGSEMTPFYGVTRAQPDGSARKVTITDSRVAPKLVLYDPEITINLPRELTATTGINALAHCIEAIYSKTRNPMSTSAALRGIRYISKSLFRCVENGDDLEARTQMMIGAYLGGTALATVEMGLHHGMCHVLGGTAGVPHGVANCIVLPHAVRFNADALAPELALAAEAMGMTRNGASEKSIALKIADIIHEMISKMRVPQRLRDVGVKQSQLPELAENMRKSKAVINNPKPITSTNEALALLQAAW